MRHLRRLGAAVTWRPGRGQWLRSAGWYAAFLFVLLAITLAVALTRPRPAAAQTTTPPFGEPADGTTYIGEAGTDWTYAYTVAGVTAATDSDPDCAVSTAPGQGGELAITHTVTAPAAGAAGTVSCTYSRTISGSTNMLTYSISFVTPTPTTTTTTPTTTVPAGGATLQDVVDAVTAVETETAAVTALITEVKNDVAALVHPTRVTSGDTDHDGTFDITAGEAPLPEKLDDAVKQLVGRLRHVELAILALLALAAADLFRRLLCGKNL